ncbi:MAG: hypothetical protein M1812_005778 [Candelaria pacifica]|nr:MAG: hypothetical protein M1812_005778 [Candelaria pacifica]
MAPLSLLSVLQNRIAVLETELRHAQAEKVAAYNGSRYLLDLLVSAPKAKGANEQHYHEELTKIKTRLQATKQENTRLKTKLRKASVGHILASRGIKGTKFRCENAGLEKEERRRGHESSETLLDDPTPAEIIDRYPAAASFSSGKGSPPRFNSPAPKRSSLELSQEQPLIALDIYEADSYGFLADTQRAPNQSVEHSKSHKSLPRYVHFFENNKPKAEQDQKNSRQIPQTKRNTLFSYSDGDETDSDPLKVPREAQSHSLPTNDSAGSVSSPRRYSQIKIDTSAASLNKPVVPARVDPPPKIGSTDPTRVEAKDIHHMAHSNGKSPLLPVLNIPVKAKTGLDVSRAVAEWVDGFNKSGSSQGLTSSEISRPYVEARVKEPRYSPNWGGQNVFKSEKDLNSAVQINGQVAGPYDLRFPDLFRFGLRYRPLERECDVLRTVIISNLPHGATIKAVLELVRGGLVVQATLLDSMSITGSKTAMICFLHALPAAEYVDFTRQHPLQVCGKTIQANLVSTPTWPMPIHLKKAIYDHDHTRCLEIANFPRKISRADLRHDLRISNSMCTDMIESLDMNPEGILSIRFSGVHYAGQAYGKLTTHRKYLGLRVSRAPDPCALPLATLLETYENADESAAAEVKETGLSDPYCSPEDKLGQDSRKASVVETSSDEETTNGNGSTGATSLESPSDGEQEAECVPSREQKTENSANLQISPCPLDLNPRVSESKPALSLTLSTPRQPAPDGRHENSSAGSTSAPIIRPTSPSDHIMSH